MSPLMQPQSVEPRQFHIRQAVAEGDGTGQGRRTLMAETQTEATAKPLARRGKTAAKNSRAPVKIRSGHETRERIESALAKELAKERQEEARNKAIGRPTVYSPELGDLICRKIANGTPVSRLIEDGLVPSHSTMWRWQEANPEFRAAVERAQEARAEVWADQLIEIADNSDLDPNDRRIRVETRWKVIGSLLYRRYGVKQQVDVNQRIDVGSTAAEVLMRLTEQARQAKLQAPDIIDITPTKG